jgi:hypothetical protein
LFVNIFVRTSEEAGTIAQKLGSMVSQAIRAHQAGSVSFTRVRPQEAGTNGIWTQFNVLAEFSYEQDN